eukprot:GHVL01007759.1.p1 GENE.GHVL01007759.1~~GHVL01007759.1.p1  ORF type:complete len:139 (+),score=28.21 GHVL01007759.1:635-1051(+)
MRRGGGIRGGRGGSRMTRGRVLFKTGNNPMSPGGSSRGGGGRGGYNGRRSWRGNRSRGGRTSRGRGKFRSNKDCATLDTELDQYMGAEAVTSRLNYELESYMGSPTGLTGGGLTGGGMNNIQFAHGSADVAMGDVISR